MPYKVNLDEFIDEFKSSRLFNHLTPQEIEDAIGRSTISDVTEGQQLVCEGDEPKSLLFVMEGALITSRNSVLGTEVPIRLLGKGECCMDAVIFMGIKSPIFVKAVSDSKILSIPAKLVLHLTQTNIHFANNMISVLAHFYKESMLQIDNLAIKDSKTRVGYYLVRTYVENQEERGQFQLQFKKSIIANYLGMTPETFSRILKELQKKDKIIEVDRENIILTDKQSLCRFCDSIAKSKCRFSTPNCC